MSGLIVEQESVDQDRVWIKTTILGTGNILSEESAARKDYVELET
jgi:hypothetical protein